MVLPLRREKLGLGRRPSPTPGSRSNASSVRGRCGGGEYGLSWSLTLSVLVSAVAPPIYTHRVPGIPRLLPAAPPLAAPGSCVLRPRLAFADTEVAPLGPSILTPPALVHPTLSHSLHHTQHSPGGWGPRGPRPAPGFVLSPQCPASLAPRRCSANASEGREVGLFTHQ